MPHLTALADEIDALASFLADMPLSSRREPEAPHEAREEIVSHLFGVADLLRKACKKATQSKRRAARRRVPRATGIHGVYVEGHYRPVVKR